MWYRIHYNNKKVIKIEKVDGIVSKANSIFANYYIDYIINGLCSRGSYYDHELYKIGENNKEKIKTILSFDKHNIFKSFLQSIRIEKLNRLNRFV